MTFAVVTGLLLMSLADGAPFNVVRPEHVVSLGAGALPNHQGDGNALTPQTLARRAASPAVAVSPTTAPSVTPSTNAMLVADLIAVEAPDSTTTTSPTTTEPVVDPRDGTGRGTFDLNGVRTAHRAHVPHNPHIPQFEMHRAHVAHVKRVAHTPHRPHIAHVVHEPHVVHVESVAHVESIDDVARPKSEPYRGRRSSTSCCA